MTGCRLAFRIGNLVGRGLDAPARQEKTSYVARAAALRLMQQSGRGRPSLLLLCLLLRSSWLTVEGGRQIGAAGLLHRRGGRAALAVSVSVAVGVPQRERVAARRPLLHLPDVALCSRAIACRPTQPSDRRAARVLSLLLGEGASPLPQAGSLVRTNALARDWLVNPPGLRMRSRARENGARPLAGPRRACSVVTWGRVAPRSQGHHVPPVGASQR